MFMGSQSETCYIHFAEASFITAVSLVEMLAGSLHGTKVKRMLNGTGP